MLKNQKPLETKNLMKQIKSDQVFSAKDVINTSRNLKDLDEGSEEKPQELSFKIKILRFIKRMAHDAFYFILRIIIWKIYHTTRMFFFFPIGTIFALIELTIYGELLKWALGNHIYAAALWLENITGWSII